MFIKAKAVIILLVVNLAVIPACGRAQAQGAVTTTAGYAGLSTQLNQIISKEKGTYGVCLIDMRSGERLGLNHDASFYAASTFKLPMNLYLWEQVAAGRVKTDTILTYKQAHYEGGTGVLQYKPIGSKFSIAALSRYSITQSDNVATNILLSYLGRSNVKTYMRGLGGKVVDDARNTTCPQDMAEYMLCLLKFASEHPQQGGILIGYLENTVFNDRIPEPLPAGIKVAHKIGNWPFTGTYNDIGYIEHPENPYILSVFSEGTESRGKAFQTIQRISRAVYEYQEELPHVKILLNDREVVIENPPLLEEGHLLVPLRSLAEAMGAEVSWDGGSRTVNIKYAETDVLLEVNSKTALIAGEEVMLPVPARIVGGRTFVPLRFVSEALKAQVDWDGADLTVNIRFDENRPEDLSDKVENVMEVITTRVTDRFIDLRKIIYA
ncbi:MAG: serine hydrolase [Bacillota bacterium]